MAKRVGLILLLSLAACGGPGRVQYDNERCLIDGHEATLSEVESRQAAVAARIQSRQPWFAIVTIIVVLVAGASNAEKAMVLIRARRHEGERRSLSERIREALDRQRQSPLRFGAIVGASLGLLALSAGLYIYLDVDKRASERALGMLQFCHLALRTAEEQGVLTEQRKNLSAIESTAGDIRALVDKLPPEEKQKAREIVTQMNEALAKQGKIVGQYVARSDEQQKALREHNAVVEKGLSSLSSELGALKSLPAALREINEGVRRIDAKVAGDQASLATLQAQLGELDDRLKLLAARSASETSKPTPPAVAASKPTPDLGVAKP